MVRETEERGKNALVLTELRRNPNALIEAD
jgi:hypothetical protein